MSWRAAPALYYTLHKQELESIGEPILIYDVLIGNSEAESTVLSHSCLECMLLLLELTSIKWKESITTEAESEKAVSDIKLMSQMKFNFPVGTFYLRNPSHADI